MEEAVNEGGGGTKGRAEEQMESGFSVTNERPRNVNQTPVLAHSKPLHLIWLDVQISSSCVHDVWPREALWNSIVSETLADCAPLIGEIVLDRHRLAHVRPLREH